MIGFSRVLIDPSNRELGDTLAEAVRHAEATFPDAIPDWGGYAGRLTGLFGPLGPPEAFATSPNGEVGHGGRSSMSRIALAWWTDPHARRHYRVMVRHRQTTQRL